jgi:hypothetical protein
MSTEKYEPYYSTMLKISEEFAMHPLTPRELQHRLVGKTVNIESLVDKITIVERPNSEIYLAAFKDVLRQFPENSIPQLMLFWFGTERPNFIATLPLLQLVTCDSQNNLSLTRNIISHACVGQLDIPRLINLPEISQHDYIVEDIRRLLLGALENQQRAESINWLYQQV